MDDKKLKQLPVDYLSTHDKFFNGDWEKKNH